jgi:sulfatase maturation enzyme AslB (radical SAM superfamily)
LFVFKLRRLTVEEKKTFKYIIENFERLIADISALVITNCDDKNDEAIQTIIKDFTDREGSKSITNL